jgi:hypothetical protein
MKKIFLLFSIVFLFNSCNVDDGISYRYEVLPIESVELPAEFELGETYTIIYRYYRPTTCYRDSGIYFEKELNTRTFASRNIVIDGQNCNALDMVLVEKTFDFYVTSNGSYIFKFWNGKDANGDNIYLEYEIPVI